MTRLKIWGGDGGEQAMQRHRREPNKKTNIKAPRAQAVLEKGRLANVSESSSKGFT